MNGMRMRSYPLRNRERKDSGVCPYATGLRKHLCCTLINGLPVDMVLRICGSAYDDCNEFRQLTKQDPSISPHARRKSRP
jgi:hypothetical protein